MTSGSFRSGPVHLVRLDTGSDLVEEITRFAGDAAITTAWVGFLGAVRRASLRYYDQEARRYDDFVIDRHLEVVAGVGNVSLIDGTPFVHAHAAFSDGGGAAFGGHLNAGCEVFALEVRIEELLGEPMRRERDDCTGLSLWGGTLP